jgi:hypothetical protein
MTYRVQPPRIAWPALVSVGLAFSSWPGSLAPAAAQESPAEPAARYPYDPLCPWGRVADGRGMLVRCLEANEAAKLTSVPAAPTNPQAALAAAAPVVPAAASPGSAHPPPPSAAVLSHTTDMPAAYAPSDAAPKVGAPAPTGSAVPARMVRKVAVTSVGPALADTGELPDAKRELEKPLDRYKACAENYGGVDLSGGQVTLRFLVRERGRAEGVLVKERKGVSIGAAKCIADVVDRRFVGYPAAPIVGATLTIELGPEGTKR